RRDRHGRLALPRFPGGREVTADARSQARELAGRFVASGDALGWFEPLYARAQGDAAAIPWCDLRPNPSLVAWLDRQPPRGSAGTALVVGCGLGDDAEHLAGRGYRVTAFDISETAVAWCRSRFPGSAVAYEARDLFQPPESWLLAFELVVEVYTLQVLPPEM